MTIKKERNNSILCIAPEGRLDTGTVSKLEEVLADSLEGVTELIFDFGGLEYISSAGLRAVLSAQKTMNRQGSMVVRNVNNIVMEVFAITGFADILTIE